MAVNKSQVTQRGGPQQQRLRRLPQNTQTRNGRGLLLALALSSPAAAQTSAFTDQATGIQLQRFFDARTNFGFGVALPTNPADSFIGQLSFPLVNGAGWGGLFLTGDREEQTLLAAWPDGRGNVVSSLRRGPNAGESSPEATGSFSVRPIASATSANSTFLTFTFLCEGCLDDTLGLGAAQAASSAEMGWKLASLPVENASSSSGVLSSPEAGSGDFSADLAAARNDEFDSWADLADNAPTPVAESQVSDLKARRRRSTKSRARRQTNGFNTDSDFSDGLSDGLTDGLTDDDFSDDDGFTSDDSSFGRVRGAITARAGAPRASKRAASVSAGRATKSRVRRQTGGGRGGFNTDTDGLTDGLTNGLTDDDGFSSDDNLIRARPSGTVAAGSRRVNSKRAVGVSAAGAKTPARRQTAGGRGGFNTDTDGLTDGLTDNTDNDGFSSDNNARGQRRGTSRASKRSTGLVARRKTSSVSRRQAGGRGGFNTDDTDGQTDNDNTDNGFSTDDNRALARVKNLSRRQVRGGRGGLNTDTDGLTDNDNTDGFSTDDNRARVGSVARTSTRGTGVATSAAPARRLARRQTGGSRNGVDTDSDGQTDFFTANETDGFSTDDNLGPSRAGQNRGVQARETTSVATTSAAKRSTFVGGGAVIARRQAGRTRTGAVPAGFNTDTDGRSGNDTNDDTD